MKNNGGRMFEFLELAKRSEKPRKTGKTTIGDEGDPVSWIREMLEIWGDYVDSVKFVPAMLLMPARVAEARVKAYRDFNLNVCLDDPIFAIAYYQGKAEQLLRQAREMGFTHCQIDTKVVQVKGAEQEKKAEADAATLGALAKELGFKLQAEVGQKHPEGDRARAGNGKLNVEAIISDMQAMLAEGCEQVFLESKVMKEAIGDYGEKTDGVEQMREIVETIGLEKIAIEITTQASIDSRNCHVHWAVRTFGPEVNFAGGASLREIRIIEAIRRGVIFIPGPSKQSSRLWVRSMARHGGKAAADWWTEPYPVAPEFTKGLR
jgi:phosphosulfolactate synthase (CoM biosynthesis protein A)